MDRPRDKVHIQGVNGRDKDLGKNRLEAFAPALGAPIAEMLISPEAKLPQSHPFGRVPGFIKAKS